MKALIKYAMFVFVLSFIMSFESIHDDASALYIMALKQHLSKIEKEVTSQSERRELANKTIFLINECGIELPKEIGSHKLQELGDSASVFISNDMGLHAIKLNPVEVNKGNIIIILSDYIVTKSNREVKFAYGGGIKYMFNYNYKRQNYTIVRTQSISF